MVPIAPGQGHLSAQICCEPLHATALQAAARLHWHVAMYWPHTMLCLCLYACHHLSCMCEMMLYFCVDTSSGITTFMFWYCCRHLNITFRPMAKHTNYTDHCCTDQSSLFPADAALDAEETMFAANVDAAVAE